MQISPPLGAKLEMEVWGSLQHSKTFYKPLLGCKAALQGMVLPSELPACREVAGLGGGGYTLHLPRAGKGSPLPFFQSVSPT